MSTELQRKLEQVRELLGSAKAAGALIGRQSNFSWLACGGEAHIPLNTDRTFGQLLVTNEKLYVLANRIEMGRLQEEAVAGLGAEPLLYEWHDAKGAVNALKEAADPKQVISDTGDWGTRGRPELFPPLRYALQAPELKRYRALGRAAEAAMFEACHAIEPGQSEFELAGQVAQACWHRQLTPVVLLIATDERIRRYRHPLPTKKKLRRHAMLVLCARQFGLIVALTRLVHFGKVPPDLAQRHKTICAVDVAFNWSTRAGRPVREVFQRGVAAYAAHGFPDEWQLHHQGGPCGYEGRDYLGSPSAPGKVLVHQPFAWNPSVTGTKSEDTIVATANGPEIITAAKDWPTVPVEWEGEPVYRPDILER